MTPNPLSEAQLRNESHVAPSWKIAIALTVILRIAYSLFAALAALYQPVNERLMHSNAFTENLQAPAGLRYLLVWPWERFDTLWYLHIAARGYDRPDAVVFFPLYPQLVKIFGYVMPPMFAALSISTIAALFLFWGLQELLRPDYGEELARQAVILCALWPASFIFFAGYPESLLVALIIWSLRMAQTNRWAAAIVLAAAATWTKAIGLVVIVPLITMALRRRRAVAPLVSLVAIAFIGCVRYLQDAGGEPLNVAYGDFWRTSVAAPWSTAYVAGSTLIHAPNPILISNWLCLILVGVLVSVSKARIEYLLYAATAIAMILCKQTVPPLQSMIRYSLIVFPAFAGLTRLTRRPLVRFFAVCIGVSILNMGLLWLFEGWSLMV
jgi:hypothetical protein